MALRNQEIAERIKALREGRGNPPQPIVAAAIQVSLRTYQNWEAGDAKPEYRNLEALAAYYKVSEEYILTGTEVAQPESPVVVSDEMQGGFEEFREHVADIRADSSKLDSRLDRIEQAIAESSRQSHEERMAIMRLLERQEDILRQLTRVAQGLPSDDALRLWNEGAQQLAEAAEAWQAGRDASPADPRRTPRRGAGGA